MEKTFPISKLRVQKYLFLYGYNRYIYKILSSWVLNGIRKIEFLWFCSGAAVSRVLQVPHPPKIQLLAVLPLSLGAPFTRHSSNIFSINSAGPEDKYFPLQQHLKSFKSSCSFPGHCRGAVMQEKRVQRASLLGRV